MRWNVPPTVRARVSTDSVLARPGHALEEAVAASEEAHHHALDRSVLADDHLLDLEQHALEGGGGLGLAGLVGSGRLHSFLLITMPSVATTR